MVAKKAMKKRAAREEAAVASEEPPPKKKKGGADDAALIGTPKAPAAGKSLTVYLRGLAFKCTEARLRRDFATGGVINQVHMPLDFLGRFRGFAFISYATQAGVDATLARNKSEYDGRRIEVSPGNRPARKAKARVPQPAPEEIDGDEDDESDDGEDEDVEDEEEEEEEEVDDGEEEELSHGKKAPAPAKASTGSPGATVFVRNVERSTTEAMLRKEFVKCGKVLGVHMPTNASGQFRSFVFIDFATKVEASAAVKMFDKVQFEGRTLFVKIAGPRKEELEQKGERPKPKSIPQRKGGSQFAVVVVGLPLAATEEKLKKHFGACGKIASVRLPPVDKAKASKISFVRFETPEGFQAALGLDGTDYRGNKISVRKAVDKKGETGDSKAKRVKTAV